MKMLGLKIKEYRIKRNITRRKLAEGVCDESTLLRIEKGIHNPRIETVQLLCSKLGIPIHYLINSEDHEEIRYINQMKQLCREFVNNEDFLGLKLILEEVDMHKDINFLIHNDFARFIKWHRAIYTHKFENNSIQAERILTKLYSQHVFAKRKRPEIATLACPRIDAYNVLNHRKGKG